MAERYYWQEGPSFIAANATGNPTDDLTAELTGNEAHHITRVMRQKVGDVITLFDGQDREFRAEIVDTRKNALTLRILETRIANTESSRRVTVAVSLPKGERQKWLIEKLTELGCYRLIPLQTERGVAQCPDQVLERLRRQVLEATKQCNRTRLMLVSPETAIADCMAECSQDDDSVDTAGFIAHPRSDGDVAQLSPEKFVQTVLPKQVLVLIGPEGGFTQNEVAQAVQLGFRPLDLGPRILRVETAALMTVAVLTALS